MNAILRKIFLVMAGAGLILAASAGWVLAQNVNAGAFSFEPRLGYYGTSNNHVNSIFTYGGAASYYVVDSVALELEGYGAYVDQNRPTYADSGERFNVDRKAYGFGSNFNIRWHMVATTQASLYVTTGIGGLWMSGMKVPYNGFESSLTENCGLGGTLALSKQVSLNGALKYMHIGQFNNQGVGAWGGTLGLAIGF